MPPLPKIKEEPVDEDLGFNYIPMEAVSSSGFSRVSPDKITSSRLDIPIVTPINNAVETTSSFAVHKSPPKIFSDSEVAYDAYNYLSRVGTHDDFDLFDGELLKSAKNDEVFASLPDLST